MSESKINQRNKNQCRKIDGDYFEMNGKTYMRMIYKNYIRFVMMPFRDHDPSPALICDSKYRQVKRQTEVPTQCQKQEEIKKQQAIAKQKEVESMKRRKEFQTIDARYHKVDVKQMTEFEVEEELQREYILERARRMMLAEQPEIKQFDSFVTNAKCQAIRDRQMREKHDIKKGKEIEKQKVIQKRYDDSWEEARKTDLRKIEEARKKKIFLDGLNAQIKEVYSNKKLERLKTEEAAKRRNDAWVYQAFTEIDLRKEKVKANEQLRKEMLETNAQLHYLQAIENEEKRILEMQRQKFVEGKERMMEDFNAGVQAKKELKEQAFQKLFDYHKKMLDKQAMVEEIKLIKTQDEQSRKWRYEKIEKAKKRIETIKKIIAEREQQVLDIRRCKAIEIDRERAELMKIANVNQTLHDRERQEEKKVHRVRDVQRRSLLVQVNNAMRAEKIARASKFEEGHVLDLERRTRKMVLQTEMLNKIEELREDKLPEKYIIETQRHFKILPGQIQKQDL